MMIARFAKQDWMYKASSEITPDGRDIEDRFKDPNDPLQLVFVTAHVANRISPKNLSTLYLDK